MLTEWFECKVRYDKTLEDGIIKRTMETYLVDAFSFTEAEKRFIAEIEPFVLRDAVKNLDKGMAGTLGDYVIVSVAETKIMDVFRYKVAEGEEA